MRRDIKVGDRIYYECYDNTIGSAIVTKIEPRTYWDNGKRYDFNMLFTGPYTCIEDYNTLARLKERHLSTKHLCSHTPIEKTSLKAKERLAIGYLTSLI